MQIELIDAVIAAKRELHPELAEPLTWDAVRAIAEREGIALVAVALARPAKLVAYDGGWMILVNSNLPARRHTYFAAHELGHLWLHRGGDTGERLVYHMDTNWSDDPREDDAELFAQRVLGERPGTSETI